MPCLEKPELLTFLLQFDPTLKHFDPDFSHCFVFQRAQILANGYLLGLSLASWSHIKASASGHRRACRMSFLHAQARRDIMTALFLLPYGNAEASDSKHSFFNLLDTFFHFNPWCKG